MVALQMCQWRRVPQRVWLTSRTAVRRQMGKTADGRGPGRGRRETREGTRRSGVVVEVSRPRLGWDGSENPWIHTRMATDGVCWLDGELGWGWGLLVTRVLSHLSVQGRVSRMAAAGAGIVHVLNLCGVSRDYINVDVRDSRHTG